MNFSSFMAPCDASFPWPLHELSKVTRATSASSSSPSAPLEKTRTSGKEGLFQSAIFAHQRSLFTYAVKHKATEDRQMNRKPGSPYESLMMPITSDDNFLINYAMAEMSTEAEGRLAKKHIFALFMDLLFLGPHIYYSIKTRHHIFFLAEF